MTAGLQTTPCWHDLSVATGAGGTFPLLRAWDNLTVIKVALLPLATWGVDAANYWTLTLPIYDEAGTEYRGLEWDERTAGLSLAGLPLTVGRPVVWYPMESRVLRDESLWVKATETGTASDLKCRVWAEVLVGRL
jgi:hypothetical protein